MIDSKINLCAIGKKTDMYSLTYISYIVDYIICSVIVLNIYQF